MKYFDDYQIGDQEISRARTVTETDIVLFAAFSGDWYPLHTDAEFAKNTPFGERIAHGFLVLTIASGLMPLTEMAIVAFYGMDKVRFTGATKIGDTIHVEMEVLDKKEHDGGMGLIAFKQSIKNQRGEEVALSTIKVLLSKNVKDGVK
ncbi:MAG: MaoC family dehydratase N-terminal domain-containing protein [Proteobacteria bacterium]|nr:MaoC family dehydratase N-terminal domain-containing protein [Pseudomonadota bacterium]